MDNLAPAISPPGGIGDSKPSNQAVLDWVQEVARLTEPENIFWCDGSEKENAWLLDQAQRQGVLIKLDEEKKPGPYLHAQIRMSRAGLTVHPDLHSSRKKRAQTTGRADDLYKLHGCWPGDALSKRCLSFPTSWARRIPP